jgi:hypothetical protein
MNCRSFAVAVVLLLAPVAGSAAPLDPASCTPAALATDDNDIRMAGDWRRDGDPVEMPGPVADQIRAAATRMISRAGKEVTDGLTCAALMPPAYRVEGFGRARLFVAELRVGSGGRLFFLIVHDPGTNAVTQAPPSLSANVVTSDDPLIKLPVVSYADLFGNKRRQVVFEERVRNGTAYNGVIYHYFDIGPRLELTRVLARETRVADPTHVDRQYQRELHVMSKLRLRLDVFTISQDGRTKRQALGYALLQSAEAGQPFHVTARHPRDKSDADTLITFTKGAGTDRDDAFLRDGYRRDD